MQAKVQRVTFPEGRRVIAVSDIHGGLDYLQGLLAKIHYAADDILVLVGDLFERGTQNLALLRYLTALCRQRAIYKVRGNWDFMYEDVFEDGPRSADLLDYMLRPERSEGLLAQMNREMGWQVSRGMDFNAWRLALLKYFPEEWAFLQNVPTILESENVRFVHAGLTSEDIAAQDIRTCIKNDNFLEQGLSFRKLTVVGHWPAANYSDNGLINYNPRYSAVQNICSIDGGCYVKSFGQLNALIFTGGDPSRLEFASYDLLARENDFVLVRQLATGITVWAYNKNLYTRDEQLCCAEATDYEPPVYPGDTLTLLHKTSRGCMIRKDGVVGWYHGRIQELQTEK